MCLVLKDNWLGMVFDFVYYEIHWPLQFATFSNFGKDIDASYTDQRGYLYLAMAVRLGCVKLA